jgi:hypothetical protein
MAIWQYQLNMIPKKSVHKKYGQIPNKLFIDYHNWEIYWQERIKTKKLYEPNFEDGRTIKWWKDVELNIEKISIKIDEYVNRADWNKNDSGFIGWKGDTKNKEDNDAHISYNIITNEISEFQLRTDLRDKQNATKFLNGMLSICQQNDLMIFNTNGILLQPKAELVFEDLKTSDAIKFLANPGEFLNQIKKKSLF